MVPVRCTSAYRYRKAQTSSPENASLSLPSKAWNILHSWRLSQTRTLYGFMYNGFSYWNYIKSEADQGYSSSARTSMTTMSCFEDFDDFAGFGAFDGPDNSHSSIRSSAEMRGNFSAFSSSAGIGSIDYKADQTLLWWAKVTVIIIDYNIHNELLTFQNNKREVISTLK